MPNYKITVEYDGTNFVGWQQQANGVSVQSSLQDSVFKLSGEKVVVYGKNVCFTVKKCFLW